VLDPTYCPPADGSGGITWFQQIEQAEKASKRIRALGELLPVLLVGGREPHAPRIWELNAQATSRGEDSAGCVFPASNRAGGFVVN
jgi:hypothetical protein